LQCNDEGVVEEKEGSGDQRHYVLYCKAYFCADGHLNFSVAANAAWSDGHSPP